MRPAPGRISSARGWRTRDGKREYHAGWDIAGKAGDPVHAPAWGVVVARWTDNTTKPYSGYGPAGVVLLDADGTYHLLGHLRAADLVPDGAVLNEGDVVGVMSTLNHVHWETRTQPALTKGLTNEDITSDPGDWLAVHGDTAPPPPPPPPSSSTPSTSGAGVAMLLLLLLAARRTR